jgi:hypothetical protein
MPSATRHPKLGNDPNPSESLGCLLNGTVEVRNEGDSDDDGEDDSNVERGEERGPLLGNRRAQSAGGIPTGGFSHVGGHASRQLPG